MLLDSYLIYYIKEFGDHVVSRKTIILSYLDLLTCDTETNLDGYAGFFLDFHLPRLFMSLTLCYMTNMISY